jgi:hypothetical protein
VDGYVSLEVPPDVAYDAAATVEFARRLHDQASFPNLLVRIPGTPQGLTAMEEAITAGVGVNVTLSAQPPISIALACGSTRRCRPRKSRPSYRQPERAPVMTSNIMAAGELRGGATQAGRPNWACLAHRPHRAGTTGRQH